MDDQLNIHTLSDADLDTLAGRLDEQLRAVMNERWQRFKDRHANATTWVDAEGITHQVHGTRVNPDEIA